MFLRPGGVRDVEKGYPGRRRVREMEKLFYGTRSQPKKVYAQDIFITRYSGSGDLVRGKRFGGIDARESLTNQFEVYRVLRIAKWAIEVGKYFYNRRKTRR